MSLDDAPSNTVAINEAELSDTASRQKEVLAFYLFGSHARGNPGPKSDVDLAVLLDPSVDKNRFFEIRLNLIGLFSSRLKRNDVDVVILNESPLTMSYQIIACGKILVDKDKAKRLAFETKVISLYLDQKPMRQLFLKSMKEKLEGGTYFD